MFLGWPSSVYLNDKNYEKILDNVKNYKNDKYIYINSLKKVKWNDNIEEIYY